MMNNPGSGSATITPNTLSAITGVLNNNPHGQTGQSPHPLSISHVPQNNYDRSNHNQYSNGAQQHNGSHPNGDGAQNYALNAADAANSAANGLFLLSQAHQELTKREEAQRAGQGGAPNGGGGNNKRGTKRKSYDIGNPQDNNVVGPDSQSVQSKPAGTKRTRANTVSSNGRGSKRSAASPPSPMDDDDDEEEEEEEAQNGKKNGNKKPETEEEKRKNFLERNRQGTLSFSLSLCTLFTFSIQPRSSAVSAKRLGSRSSKPRSSSSARRTRGCSRPSSPRARRSHV